MRSSILRTLSALGVRVKARPPLRPPPQSPLPSPPPSSPRQSRGAPTQSPPPRFAPCGEPVTSVCFSPDGKQVASGSWDRTVRLWDVETGACVRTLEGPDDIVHSACFSPDVLMVASGSADATARLWLLV